MARSLRNADQPFIWPPGRKTPPFLRKHVPPGVDESDDFAVPSQPFPKHNVGRRTLEKFLRQVSQKTAFPVKEAFDDPLFVIMQLDCLRLYVDFYGYLFDLVPPGHFKAPPPSPFCTDDRAKILADNPDFFKMDAPPAPALLPVQASVNNQAPAPCAYKLSD